MSNSFSMLFSDGGADADNMSVDCTLSLATPSTRAARPSPFGWNILPPPAGRSNAGEPLLARRCANCGTASTPLWRNGPRGPKSLCNACGIRFKKEERRAAAVGHVEAQHGSWAQAQKAACYASAYGNEFRFGDGDGVGRDSEFMAWRFNVADRPGLVHDFTR